MDNKLLVLVVFVVLMFVVQIFVWMKVSTTGGDLSGLEEKVKQLELENRRIEQEISVFTSLAQISSRSAQLGFEQPTEVVYPAPEQK